MSFDLAYHICAASSVGLPRLTSVVWGPTAVSWGGGDDRIPVGYRGELQSRGFR